MRAQIPKKYKGSLTKAQEDIATQVLRNLRKVHTEPLVDIDGDPAGSIEIAQYAIGNDLLRVEMYKDGHWPPETSGVGGTIYWNDTQLAARAKEQSWGATVCRHVVEGSITKDMVEGRVHHPEYKSDGKKAKAPDARGIVIESDHVLIEGIKLKRWPNPGPLTPRKDQVTEPKGVDRELKVVAAALANNFPLLLFGDSGTGKTTILEYLAYLCNVNLVKVVGDNEYGPSLWLGHLHASQGNTYWVNGDLPNAMQGIEGKGQTWLFVDELSRMLPDNTSPLMPVLERRGGKLGRLRLTDNPDEKNKMVEAHADFRVVMGMNPFDGDFVGTQEVDLALLRRISVQVELDYPSIATQAELLREANPKAEAKHIARVTEVGQKIRDNRKAGRLALPCSPDVLDAWLKLIPTLGFKHAAEVTVINKATIEERPQVKQIIESGIRDKP